jgi:hypothetical protein
MFIGDGLNSHLSYVRDLLLDPGGLFLNANKTDCPGFIPWGLEKLVLSANRPKPLGQQRG